MYKSEERERIQKRADQTRRREGERPSIRQSIHYHLTDLHIALCESNGKGHTHWPKPSKKGTFHSPSLSSLLSNLSVSYMVHFLFSDNVLWDPIVFKYIITAR